MAHWELSDQCKVCELACSPAAARAAIIKSKSSVRKGQLTLVPLTPTILTTKPSASQKIPDNALTALSSVRD
eukprot:8770778-Karenia_brevis.AAC.1